jgi:demethylmenaquinone methyltransferase / 2-methoxy-6-polyprenyl-1,4-benzoquinol methylase
MLTTRRSDPNRVARELFRGLPPRYDLLGYLLSFGQDRRWRSEMVGHVPPGRDSLVLDVATGPAGVAFELRRRTSSTVVGLDLSPEMLARARTNISRRAERRIVLVRGRGEALPFADGTFDALTFTYLLRYVEDPAAVLAELARVVKPGGEIASLEFHVPDSAPARYAWYLYTRLLLPVGGLLLGGRDWWQVGRFLGPSISTHYREYPVSWLLEAWRRAGISGVDARRMSLGGGLVVWGVRDRQVPT